MQLVSNAERLERVLGRWPSFHDAELTRLVLNRAGADGPTLDVDIHVWRTTSEVDAAGAFVTESHTLAGLRFHGVAVLELSEFNHQNVLFDLVIEAIDPELHEGRRLEVQLRPSFGVGASFECSRCEVFRVEPWSAAP